MTWVSKIVIFLAAVDAVVGLGYAWNHDWARTVYWLCAAALCAATIFMR